MIRIGVIGAGGRGGLAKLAHRPEEGAELVAACDIRPEVLEQYKGQYGAVAEGHGQLARDRCR